MELKMAWFRRLDTRSIDVPTGRWKTIMDKVDHLATDYSDPSHIKTPYSWSNKWQALGLAGQRTALITFVEVVKNLPPSDSAVATRVASKYLSLLSQDIQDAIRRNCENPGTENESLRQAGLSRWRISRTLKFISEVMEASNQDLFDSVSVLAFAQAKAACHEHFERICRLGVAKVSIEIEVTVAPAVSIKPRSKTGSAKASTSLEG